MTAGITKEMYFEMCNDMGSIPIEEEIPITLTDFPLIVQEAFVIYNYLQDVWEGMSGTYMGKNMSSISSIFDILGTEEDDKKIILELVVLIDSARAKQIASSKPKEDNKTPTT